MRIITSLQTSISATSVDTLEAIRTAEDLTLVRELE